jgi:hypothetical protein
MAEQPELALPFVTRDMFRYKDGTTYTLTVVLQTRQASVVSLSGSTREGPFTYKMTGNATGAKQTFNFRISDYPTFLTAFIASGVANPGTVYITISLQINGDVMQGLMQGYITSYKALTWPQITYEPALPKQTGNLSTISSTDPAVGVDIDYTFPTGFSYFLRNATMTLTTDVTVASRQLHISLQLASGVGYEFISPAVQLASTTRTYKFQPGDVPGVDALSAEVLVPIPQDLWIGDGCRVITSSYAFQGGDNYSAISLGVEGFITP